MSTLIVVVLIAIVIFIVCAVLIYCVRLVKLADPFGRLLTIAIILIGLLAWLAYVWPRIAGGIG